MLSEEVRTGWMNDSRDDYLRREMTRFLMSDIWCQCRSRIRNFHLEPIIPGGSGEVEACHVWLQRVQLSSSFSYFYIVSVRCSRPEVYRPRNRTDEMIESHWHCCSGKVWVLHAVLTVTTSVICCWFTICRSQSQFCLSIMLHIPCWQFRTVNSCVDGAS